jgi:hypothetical protein
LGSGFRILSKVTHFRGFLLLLQAILAGSPLFRLGSCCCSIGKPFKAVELGRAALNPIFGLLVTFLRWCRHVLCPREGKWFPYMSTSEQSPDDNRSRVRRSVMALSIREARSALWPLGPRDKDGHGCTAILVTSPSLVTAAASRRRLQHLSDPDARRERCHRR